MKPLLILLNLLIFLAFLSCSKDDSESNCYSLRKGLINKDRALIQTEVNKILKELTPKPSISDPNGHLENLSTFMTKIQDCNEITCELECYNCFHQLMIESLVKISTDSSGVMIIRTIFINTPENKKMSFMDIL